MATGCLEVFAMAAAYKVTEVDTNEITEMPHALSLPVLAVHASPRAYLVPFSAYHVKRNANGALRPNPLHKNMDSLLLWKQAAQNPAAICTSMVTDKKVKKTTLHQNASHATSVCGTAFNIHMTWNPPWTTQNVKSTDVSSVS